MRRPIPPSPSTLTASKVRTQLDLATEEAITPKEELLAQIETLHAKELELATTLEKSLAEGAKWKARATAAKAKAKAIALVHNSNAGAEVDVFQKVLGLVGRGAFTVAHEETFLQRQMALKETEPFLHMNVLLMAQAVMRYDREMQRLERRVGELEVEAGALGAVRRFECWRGTGEGGEGRKGTGKSTGAVEDVVLGAGNPKGGKLVDLKEWPLPPKRTSWVMVQGERKRKRHVKQLPGWEHGVCR